MGKLTAEQVKQLADDFMQMANALGDYRYDNYEALTEEKNKELKELHYRTLSLTTDLYTKSAVLVMEEVETSLVQIDEITLETKKLYAKLTGVQKVLDRATAILTLASAIISLDPKGIVDAIKNLLTSDSGAGE